MTVKELIMKLSKMPMKMEVLVQDGMDPSDMDRVNEIRIEEIDCGWLEKGKYVVLDT